MRFLLVARAKTRFHRIAYPLLFSAAAALFLARRMYHGYNFALFGDEIEHIVGAKVIASGGLLYRDFVDEHGPVPFMLAQAYGAIAGWVHPLSFRFVPMIFALATTYAVTSSPALRGGAERLTAAGLFMGLLASVWIVQGLCLADYQFMGGAALVVACAFDSAPAWAGERSPAYQRSVAGAAHVFACFVAYSYGPASCLLLASRIAARWGEWRELMAIAIGGIFALAIMTIWLAIFSDPVGYLVYHFIVNEVYFAPYFHLSPWSCLQGLIPRQGGGFVVQALANVLGFAGLVLFFYPLRRGRHLAPILAATLAFATLVLSNPRGDPGFQNAAFLVLAIALFSLALPRATRYFATRYFSPGPLPSNVAISVAILAVLVSEITTRHALSTPHGLTRRGMANLPPELMGRSDEPWAIALRRAVRPTERILSFPYLPVIYLRADRLPMNGYYDYLPQDADYAKDPWFGRTHDLCRDFSSESPPVVYTNDWVVWGRRDPKVYMACVFQALRRNYSLAPGAPGFLVRKDRLPLWLSSMK